MQSIHELTERLTQTTKEAVRVLRTIEMVMESLNGNGTAAPVVKGFTRRTHHPRRANPTTKVRPYARTIKSAAGNGKTHPNAGIKLNLSPKRRAELKLQGKYIGHTRMLSSEERERVGMLRKRKGYRASIALAKVLEQQRQKRLGVSVAAAAPKQ